MLIEQPMGFFIQIVCCFVSVTLPSKKSGAEMQPQVKPARRVLPEHEGRYKITLPSGTTERSKEILAKKAMREYSVQ